MSARSAPSARTRVAVALLLVEALLGAAWWTLLVARPDAGDVVLPRGVDASLIRTFAAADLAFYVVAPAATAWGIVRERPWARALAWLHAGGLGYAALWGWGTFATTGDLLLGAALMTPPALVAAWIAATTPRGAVA